MCYQCTSHKLASCKPCWNNLADFCVCVSAQTAFQVVICAWSAAWAAEYAFSTAWPSLNSKRNCHERDWKMWYLIFSIRSPHAIPLRKHWAKHQSNIMLFKFDSLNPPAVKKTPLEIVKVTLYSYLIYPRNSILNECLKKNDIATDPFNPFLLQIKACSVSAFLPNPSLVIIPISYTIKT